MVLNRAPQKSLLFAWLTLDPSLLITRLQVASLSACDEHDGS